jgi:hypothetical protein
VPATPDQVRLTILARDTTSWLEVRRDSAHGALLYSGQLEPGHTLRFRGVRVWARFGSAGHLAIAVNGRPLALIGTLEHVFTAARG